MITCQHAHQLFDRYLDGELSASLQTELHAHRLNCTSCQNELALMEACGDVITMDRCEPQVSLSFTDRVVLAQRGRRPSPQRRWGRAFWFVGSPMAAAASIAFTLFVIMPQGRTTPSTEVAAYSTAVPADAQKNMLAASGKQLSSDAQRALAQTPTMADGSFLDTFLAPIVERSKTTVEGTLRSAQELQMLMQRGLSDPDQTLLARWQALQQDSRSSTGLQPGDADWDPLDPTNLMPPADSAGSSSSEPKQLEAL